MKETIQEVRPELILSFGGPATEELTGKGPISKVHGGFYKLLPKYEHECYILAQFHPSYVMRRRDEIPVMIRDLEKVHTFFTSGAPKEVASRTRFYLDPTAEELREYLISSYRDEIVAFDTETTSLNTREAKLLGASFSKHKDTAMAIYLSRESDPRWSVIKEFLENSEIRKCAQNGSYDCAVLLTNGINVKGLTYDTRLAEQLLNSDSPKDLGHLRAVYTDIPPYKPTKKDMENIQTWGKDRMLNYAALDAQCTYQVMEKQIKLLSQGQMGLLKNLLVPVCLTLNKMERIGIKVDVPKLAIRYAETIPKIESLEKELQEGWGINPNSPKQICTTFGLSSSDKETLRDHVRRNGPNTEVFSKILACRDLSKGAATFLKGIYERLEEGRIHTQYRPEGTGTGRLSSSNPNLQNIQKPFRAIYTSDSEEYCLLACDYKQLELRVLSVLAPCPVLKGDLDSGVDIHEGVRKKIYDYVPEHIKWNARMIAKAVVFGTIYGRTPRSIAMAFGVSIKTAEDWQAALTDRYPGVGSYIIDRTDDYKKFGKVTTPFGRTRLVENARQAVNSPIQSTANDIALYALLRLDQEGFDLRLTTHDEIVSHVRISELEKYAKIQKEIMEMPVPELGNAIFPVDVKVGWNWYELKVVEDFKREVLK